MSETELKLSVTESNLEAAHHWLMGQGAGSAGPPLSLRNRYFDTPDGRLNRERVALRLRETGDQVIQTLKTGGHMQSGAMQREEWEWTLSEPVLDLACLEQTPLAGHPALDDLRHCFDTDFERRVLDLSTTSPGGVATLIECAIDRGAIRANAAEAPLQEVELELKSGDEQALSAVALEMVRSVPALVNSISKAEQGYYLAGLHRLPESAEDALKAWMDRLCGAWQSNDPALWPELLDRHHALESRAKAVGCSELFERVSNGLETAAAREESPRERLMTLPGLAALQLRLLIG